MPSFDAMMAIATVNDQQDERINELSATLKLRTATWRKTTDLTDALREASSTMVNTPNKVDGYLYAGTLYSIQGRQHNAIQVFEKGMELVSPDDPEYTLFKQLKGLADSLLQRRIDFIAHIPYDVLCNIIGYLDAPSAGNCTFVCRYWRNTLLECPEPWRVVNISRSAQNQLTPLNLLPTVSRHVERLSLLDETKMNMKCIGLFGKHKFSNLRSLDIIDPSPGNIDMSASLYTALCHVSKTLSELRLDTPRLKTEILLGTILSTCRNLTTIECRVSCIRDCYTGVSVPYTTLLTTVDLRPTRQTISVNSLAPLFEKSPHLESLILGYCHYDILSVLGDYCPKLTTIVANIHDFGDLYNSVKSLPAHADGLQCLSLDPVVSTKPILPRLAKSAHSLRALYVTPCSNDGEGTTLSDWSPLSSFVMHKLTHVYIDALDAATAFHDNIPAMLRCYPHVETLRLQNFYGDEGGSSITEGTIDGICNAIATMKNLSHLRLVCFDIRSEAFVRLLELHQGEQSRLRKLFITGCEGMTGEVLCNAARIQSLQELGVHYLPDTASSVSDITDFAYWVGQLPRLKYLDLGHLDISMEAAQYIASSAQLYYFWSHDVVIPEEGAALLQRHIQDVQMYNST
ncbi:hypothetical protein BJV82DRAFT_590255 [Fennellomyces sp. T-0311]|nr:hypothetical protein BJV82DRAFT_590255 [Fennellomyces sp. T-0311]